MLSGFRRKLERTSIKRLFRNGSNASLVISRKSSDAREETSIRRAGAFQKIHL